MNPPLLYARDLPHLSDDELRSAMNGEPREADYHTSIALLREWIGRGLDD